MWRKILDILKGGMIKIGLLKSLEDIKEHKDISINKEMFEKIDMWKDLYKGYHSEIHDVHYQTIEGRKERVMLTMNLPKVACNEMASLIYNEKCDISIDNETVDELIQKVFKDNKFAKKFQDYLEYSFAHGGMVIKPYVEDGKIMLSFITADCFIPISWRNDSIYEAVFPFEFKHRDKNYTHLEWHLWEGDVYVIKNEVYESRTGTDLGTKVSLHRFFPNLEEEVRITGLKRSVFSYFKPNTANNIDTESPLGISLYSNAIDTLKAIDTAFDSFNREFRLGKKKIIVPAHMVKTTYDQYGKPRRYFDPNDESYEAFNTDNMDADDIKAITTELRVDEHVAAINALLNIFAMQTGFSSGAFTFDGQSMKTATEVVSEQSKTFKSKQSHEIIIEAALQELIGSIVVLAQLYEIISTTGDYEVIVSFDDSIAEDKDAEIDRQIKLTLNGLQSKKRAAMDIFGITEEDAIELIQEIYEEEYKHTERQEREETEQETALFGSRE